VTRPFIEGLGSRLAAWVDHHDHALHGRYRDDPRFVLSTKAEHGACPEMITPALVARMGPVDSVVCHLDLDGLFSAAKWIRGGHEPYPGADDDARAVDTRQGTASPLGRTIDRALRAAPRDDAFLARVVRFLAAGATETTLRHELEQRAEAFEITEMRTRDLAERFRLHGRVAFADITGTPPREYDKTLLLLLGQAMAPVAMVVDEQNVALAAAFDSGLNFLTLLQVEGGMPTRVSVPRSRLDEVVAALKGAGLYRE
jgi:hypothetical protein